VGEIFMKDKEIIKALECCSYYITLDECVWNNCPFMTEKGCSLELDELQKLSLDLINRLKRESNKYRYKAQAQKGDIARLNKQVAKQTAQIDGLQEEVAIKTDVLNRQKAEIKSLTEKLEALGDPLQDAHYKIAEQQAEIERLTKIVEEQHEGSLIAMEVYKNEAIKEFAGRYEKIKTDRLICSFCCFKDGVDDLVKEMVGDAK
jgi:uncharacterized coiled-coil protein SlyX